MRKLNKVLIIFLVAFFIVSCGNSNHGKNLAIVNKEQLNAPALSFVQVNRDQARKVAINLGFYDVEAGANMLLAQMGVKTDWGKKSFKWNLIEATLHNSSYSDILDYARNGIGLTIYAEKMNDPNQHAIITSYHSINKAYNIEESTSSIAKFFYSLFYYIEKIFMFLLTLVALGLFGIGAKRRSRVNANTAGVSRRSRANANTDAQAKIKNWSCYKCGKVVEASSVPNAAGCPGSNRSHGWENIGILGDNKYECTKCGAFVRAKSIPNGGCPNGNSHIFQRL